MQINQDFVKVELHLNNGKTKIESHIYPVRDFVKHPKREAAKQQQQRALDQLNIVFLCVDSLSRSAAIRNIPKFYDMVREDPDSIIMKVIFMSFCYYYSGKNKYSEKSNAIWRPVQIYVFHKVK